MSVLKHLKNSLFTSVFGVLFAGLIAGATITTPLLSTPVYAEPETSETEETEESTETQTVEQSEESEIDNTCYDQVGAIGWLICPTTGVIAKAIDAIYGIIEDLLTVKPIAQDDSSPIYLVWQILRDVTNIVFVIFLLIVVYSQITGLGINNYGIKKALPKLIIAAVLVNLSFLICSLAVDISNIVGVSLRGVFNSIEESAIASGGLGEAAKVSWVDLVAALAGGGAIAGLAISTSGGLGAFLWMLVPVLIGGILAIFVGLITVALRQAVVSMLIMISPLAMVAYLLPNTEQYFKKWKDMLTQMLVFFPMFSLLFGAAQLAGWALIASASSAFGVILGMAVQVFPLFLSISLMKMSGTVLGAVSSKLTGLTAKANAGAGNWANSWREQRKQRYLANSNAPAAGLRRYLDYRAKLREEDLKNSTTIREGNAIIRAQGKLRGNTNYDPGADNQVFKANSYTRNAKLAANMGLTVKAAQDDTQHVLSNYDKYHNSHRTDVKLATDGAQGFKEMNRAAFTLVNDDEADYNWLTSEYLKAARAGDDSYQYKHFVKSSGGGLGDIGATSVLGQMIAKTAANEARHRHDFAILGAKFNVDKRAFRDMFVGYYNNDDGLATFAPDENGKRKLAYYVNEKGEHVTERYPGEFLMYHPEALHAYKLRDENGIYFEMKDLEGEHVTRIYKHDTPVMKEIIQNFDTVIQDPIDGLYGILSGIKEGSLADIKDADGNSLQDVGISTLRTTVARSIQGAKFKEKAAFAGPMYTTAVARGYIKNFVDQNVHRLDGIVKAVKSGNFNVQDQFELNLLADLMDPKNFENNDARLKYLFPEDALRQVKDVNGKDLEGTIFDEFGKAIGNVPHNKATYEQLLNTIKKKYLYPGAQAMAYMMSRATTPNVADSQKSGGAEAWGHLADSINGWVDTPIAKTAHLPNPYKRETNVNDRANDMKQKIRDASAPVPARGAYATNNPASSDNILRNHIPEPSIDPTHYAILQKVNGYKAQIEMFRSAYMYDPFNFSQATLRLIGEDPEFQDVYYEFTEFIDMNEMATTEEMYESVIESFGRFEY